MYVYRSNRAEALAEALAQVVGRPLEDPAARECIVVQGRGMERWLSMELSRRLGVWANPDFPFPRRLIERAVESVLGADPAPAMEPESAMWSIAAILPSCLSRPEFAEIRRYLDGDERGIRLIQLAQRLADTFDHYTVYRPEMILGWDQGKDGGWQARLWRMLRERHGLSHVAARARDFFAALRRGSRVGGDFPRRLSLFGLSTLPPLYVRILGGLAQQVEVHLFLLSPSSEYWGEIRSRREMLRRRQPEGGGASEEALSLVEGNPLLASLGRLGRDFQEVLESLVDYTESGGDLYRGPGAETVLAALQADILDLVNRGREGQPAPLPFPAGDVSVQVHSCHGPMREIEILHDQLLALFDGDHDLQPHDVVVMTPSIDAFAPYIEAVFDSRDRPFIPYRLADRSARASLEVFDALLRLLAVLRGRMTAPEVLDLLAIEVIGSRFGICADDLELLRKWITESGIRWGVDAAHREAVGQPPFAENTWRFGLDRLLLGYAMCGENRLLFAGVLPYDDVEGTEAVLLGRLAEFAERLFDFRDRLQAPRSLDDWRRDLGALLEAMIDSDEASAYQHRQIQEALAELAARGAKAGFEAAVDLDALRAELERELQRGAAAHGFLSGGVTFCEMVPMRSIPFRVVCLVGMSDGAFPRIRRPLGFDLVAQRPRPGDRSQRDDDRYLFLEALLSARDRLLITYTGQSISDNTAIPPSVVVSELLDAVRQSFELGAPGGVERALVVRHPLQPFSPRYFREDGDRRLFSYVHSYCNGAAALRERHAQAPFVSAPLRLEPGALGALDLEDLIQFFRDPSKYFLQRRLGLYLGGDAPLVEDREPIALDNLERWEVGDALLKRRLDGVNLEAALAAMRASGRLPLGVPGTCLYADLCPEVEALAKRAEGAMSGGRLSAVEIDAEIGGTHLTGVLRDVFAAAQVRHQFSRLGGASELELWIRHLALSCFARAPYPRRSILIGRPVSPRERVTEIRFRPVPEAAALLERLLLLYRIGQEVPLPLFKKASRIYAQKLAGKGEAARQSALAGARQAYEDRGGGPWAGMGDAANAYVAQIYGDRDPLDPDFASFACRDAPAGVSFAAAAEEVFGPLLAHREEVP